MILLVAATHNELDVPMSALRVEKLICGIGPVEAAASVAHALAMKRYRLVINVGIAGALPGTLNIGSAVVVHDEFYPLELETGVQLALPDAVHVVTHALSDAHLVAALVHRGFPSVRGLTVSRVTSTHDTARRIAAHDVQVESMEGFAVLRAAEMAGIPAFEIRGISNFFGVRSESRWDFLAGVKASQHILDELLTHLSQDGSHGT